jgi:hypothetical protein
LLSGAPAANPPQVKSKPSFVFICLIFCRNELYLSYFPRKTYQGGDFEAKVTKLVELGFDRASVVQALKLFNGNEEQAAAFLFG